MATNFPQILKAGLQANYDVLQTKDSNVLYFCTDTKKIYKGAVDYTAAVEAVATRPAAPAAGRAYLMADTGKLEAFVDGAWKTLSLPTVTSIDANADDNHVATAKAVYDAIQQAVSDVTGGAAVLSDVTLKADAPATLVVKKGDGSTADVQIAGAVTSPVWDATQRKLTLPVAGGTAVEVNIGKDIFVDSAADNKYNAETGNIELHLNDGTMIEIPASAFIDVYTGGTANGTSVTVGEDNVISVALVLDPAANNALTLSANGLMLSLDDYCKTTDVDAKVKAVQDAVDKLNDDASVEGSVANKVAAHKTEVDASISGINNEINDLKQADVNADAAIKANTEEIAALAAATTTWGTF